MREIVLLSVPASLAYRQLACRAVSAVAGLCVGAFGGASPTVARRFTNELVSAVGEAFNNVVLHAYADSAQGTVDLELAWSSAQVVVELHDTGASFDFDAVRDPDLNALHEKGVGVYIIRSFVDRAEYRSGTPNVLVLTKRLDGFSRRSSVPSRR